MKGQQSLFSELFEEQVIRTEEKPRPRNFFMPDRNLHLAYRYYFWAEIKFMRYDKCLEYLEKEFYITDVRIIDILSDNRNSINEIVKTKPTIKDLQKIIPHLNWLV